MRTLSLIVVLTMLVAGSGWGAEPGQPGESSNEQPAPTGADSAQQAPDSAAVDAGTNGVVTPTENGTNCLRLNFRGASLEAVLNYLSEAAGFIIVLEVQPRGKVDVWSNQPLTKEEALELLSTVLNRNGYAAIRRGRTLTIVNKDDAKTKAIPVHLGADPQSIPETDEIVTQILPVRFVEAAQLLKDITPLVSPQTSMTANESGNSIVITDTQANIHRVAEVIKCIDSGAEDMTVVKVFKLRNSNASEMSDLLTSLFPDDSRSGGSQAPFQFGGGPGGAFRRMMGGGGPFGGGNQAAGSNSQNQRIKKRNRVIAVPDQRTASVIVTATKDLMEQIVSVVEELDGDRQNIKTVAVIPLEHAAPQDALQVLQDIFGKSGMQNNRNQTSQNNALLNRSTQQNQQNNNNAARSGMNQGARKSGLGQ